ncbi:DedA family protein [Aeromonas molluscorum]|uniref:DedA family protein n=1 Tax=Aeromonas molluscorum TaxID=271417 RepID=UPI00058B7CAD|nr:DedA family protein [Aeromonas molluscorum]
MDLILSLVDVILHIDVHLKALFADYGVWIYAILFLIIFCETGLVVMPFLPGDSLLFAAGALTVDSALDVHLLSALLVLAAVLGDLTNYTLGRLFGERLFSRSDSRLFRQDHLHQTHAFFARHGGKAIIIARFAPIVRTFAPFVAGMGKMSYPRFMAFNGVGALCWVLAFVYVGHFFGNLPLVKENFTLLIFVIIVISLLPHG